MKRTLRVALVAGLAVGFAPVVSAQEEPLAVAAQEQEQQEGDLAALVDETPDLWFVELSSPPLVEGTSAATLRSEKATFRANAKKAGLAFSERYAFDRLFNGLSIRIDKGDLAKLGRIDGVKAIWPVLEAKTTSAEATPEMATALGMTGADVAQSQLGYTGRGVKVAVMDTGIDIDHPDFGGSGTPGSTLFPTTRIAYGYDFVGDAFTGGNTPVPDNNPDDCGGHGSHVAGIIGANGVVKGVAPEVTFGAYRVFGCSGSTNSDIMIAAMERALADGMQVLNMSIGSAFMTWPQYPTAAAATRLVNKGVVVVASIGNSGANGLYSAGAPGVGDKVIGVASFDNTTVTQFAFTITPDAKAIGYGGATAAPLPPLSGTFAMVRTGTQTSTADGCAALPASLSGEVVLIRRGGCTFYEKALNAQNAGALGVVLYNNAPGTLNPTVAGAVTITIPVVMISQANGNLIDSRLASGPVDLTWTNQTVTGLSSTGGRISSFSSYGLNAELTVKPDIGAPGGDIWSTYPLEANGYANLGGTSMASPHTAGAVALLLEARPHTSSQSVRGILQNSADPKNWTGNPSLGYLDQVHRQGAGMLDIDDAILSTVRIDPAQLSLGESEAGPATRTLALKNDGATDITLNLSHVPALSSGGAPNAPSAFTGFAAVAFSAPSVIVPAGGTATVDVTITANPGLADKSMYGGYIVFTPQGGGQTYRVPYAGFKGDYQSVQVLVPTASNFPWLAKLGATSYLKQSAGATFSFASGDVPYFLVHLEHQARRLRMEVVDTSSGKSWHRAFDEEYLPRNSTATGFFALPWDGITVAGNKLYQVPDGQYVMKLSILKALGDPANPAHWETWTSPVFNIDRP